MNSNTSWSERGLSPELYQAARQAADRAGMSVTEWLNSTFGDSAAPAPRLGGSLGSRLGDLSQRFSRSGEGEPAAAVESASKLADAASRLNARLEQLNYERDNQAVPSTADPSPSPARRSFSEAVAEIAARQRLLASAPPPAPMAPPIQPYQTAPQTDPEVSSTLAGLRADLGNLSRVVQDALPHQTLERLQNEVERLSERIDHGHRGPDASVLEGIERTLGDFQERLNHVTPTAELAALDARLNDLSRKIEGLGGSPDPETLRYLEAAINELRELSAGVASAEGVASLAGDIQALAERVDRLAERAGSNGIEVLSQRVDQLTHSLDSRVGGVAALPPNLEALITALTEKLDQTEVAARDQAAFAHLEKQLVRIADKVEAADSKLIDFSSLERGIQELTTQVRRTEAAPQAGAEVVAIRRDLESLHVNQVESEHRTHETLEAVHDTLERLVERLSTMETARAEVQAAEPPQHHPAPALMPAPPIAMAEPEPAPRSAPMPMQRVERQPINPDLPADTPLEPGSTGRARTPSPAERIAASEAALGGLKAEPAPELTGKANFIAAARRAAQAAANEGNPVEGPRNEERKDEETPTSLIGRFLANRRRALMLGVSALLVLYGAIQLSSMFDGSGRSPEPPAQKASQAQTGEPQKMAQSAPPAAPVIAAAEPTAPVAPAKPAATAPAAIPVTPVKAAPSTPDNGPGADALLAPTPAANQTIPTAPPAANEVTGSVTPQRDIAAIANQIAAPATLDVPAAIGGPSLRAAAAAGNAAAQYEIGVRYSEGHGVPANLETAAQWFDRAAQQGLAPALYRLGSMYEKGQGVRKNTEKARELYLLATDKGNAKATHNLAVLYAEGIDGKPDYKTAAQWFRKAADRGVADSQYNLGILYARGIGADQNLAESYKWFALAANQGDKDAAKKRDEVAARLDQQSLVAAKLAVQTWVVDAPPEAAMDVKAPAGGWDRAATTAPAKAAKPKKTQSPS